MQAVQVQDQGPKLTGIVLQVLYGARGFCMGLISRPAQLARLARHVACACGQHVHEHVNRALSASVRAARLPVNCCTA